MSSELTPNSILLSAKAAQMATSFILYMMLSYPCVVDFAYILSKYSMYMAEDMGMEPILIIAK